MECRAPFVPVEMRQTGRRGAWNGARKEALTGADREPASSIEPAVANEKTTGLACKETANTEQTYYYRWRNEFDGLQVDQARQPKEFEPEDA